MAPGHSKRFSGQADLKLMELVKQHPMLYDSSHKKYFDHESRDLIWKSIGETLQLPARQCRQRWTNIRDTYRRKLKERLKDPENAKSYRFEDELAFMIPYYKDCTTVDDMENDYSDLFNDSAKVESVAMPSEVYIEENLDLVDQMQSDESLDDKPYLKFRNNKIDTAKTPRSSGFNPVPKERLSTSDPVDVFLMTIRNTLREFRPYFLNQAKSKIFQTVQDCELKQMEETDPIPVKSVFR